MITVAELNVECEKAKEYNKKDLSREKRLKRAGPSLPCQTFLQEY